MFCSGGPCGAGAAGFSGVWLVHREAPTNTRKDKEPNLNRVQRPKEDMPEFLLSAAGFCPTAGNHIVEQVRRETIRIISFYPRAAGFWRLQRSRPASSPT